MLQRKPSNRLGSNGPREVKQHPWFKNFPWDKLTKKELMTPFRPNVNNAIKIQNKFKFIVLSQEETTSTKNSKYRWMGKLMKILFSKTRYC